MPDPGKQITKARIAMQIHHPFFGYLATSLEPVAKPEMKPPTMATDGTHLFYHPDFVLNIPLSQLSGVIAHEIGHIILNHIPRRQTREPKRWNLAADYADNELVLKDGFVLPEGCLYKEDYAEKSVETIYNELPVKYVDVAVTLDSHEEWNGWGGNGKDQGDQGDQGIDDMMPDIEQQWRERVAQAVTQARMRGKVPAHIEQLVGDLLQPRLDWKTILQDMITSCAKSDFTFTRANKKHLWRGIYLPGMTGTEIRIAVVIDSSGSISDEEIVEFLSEVQGICEAYDDYTIWLYVCDARIHQRFELHLGDPLPQTVQGRGGTDFREPLKEAEDKPITSLVYFTDLYGTFPDKEPHYPVIWVSTTDAKAPWGFVIKYPQKERKQRR